jgi:hypothetical protein
VLRVAVGNTGPCKQRCLTPPSSGRFPACFARLQPPLMSNVSRHERESVACVAPSSAVAHCLSRSAEPARSRQSQRAGVAVRPAAARAPSGKCCERYATVALGCPSVGGQRTGVLRAAKQRERVRGVRCAVYRNARTLAAARTWLSAPALRVRSACAAFVLWPRLASAMRPMPAAAVAALVACERPLGAAGLPTLCCLRKHGPP